MSTNRLSRRRFLKSAAIGAVSFAMSACVPTAAPGAAPGGGEEAAQSWRGFSFFSISYSASLREIIAAPDNAHLASAEHRCQLLEHGGGFHRFGQISHRA